MDLQIHTTVDRIIDRLCSRKRFAVARAAYAQQPGIDLARPEHLYYSSGPPFTKALVVALCSRIVCVTDYFDFYRDFLPLRKVQQFRQRRRGRKDRLLLFWRQDRTVQIEMKVYVLDRAGARYEFLPGRIQLRVVELQDAGQQQ